MHVNTCQISPNCADVRMSLDFLMYRLSLEIVLSVAQGVLVVTTTKLYSAESEFRFFPSSNPACSVLEFSSVSYFTIALHPHHHQLPRDIRFIEISPFFIRLFWYFNDGIIRTSHFSLLICYSFSESIICLYCVNNGPCWHKAVLFFVF